MNLNKLKLKNFRSYSQETEIKISDLNVLIGKNDVGKSSIMESLDIFFNGKPDINDLCINNDNSRIEITCEFTDLPNELILDDTIATSLADEYLLNADEKLEIKKTFPISTSGSISEESVIICEYPDKDDLASLLSKKRATLQLQFDQLGIDPKLANKNKSKELRNAIRNYFYEDGEITTQRTEIKIDGRLDNEDNRKKIWTNLKKYLPIFSLFFVDKQLNDQDSDIQDPMKEIIKEVLKRDKITPLLNELKEAVQEASTKLADETIEKLNDLDSELAETLRSNFPKEPSWNSIFKLTLGDDRGVPLNKRGSGMRRLVLLSFFRAQVENRRTENAPNIIYALEEPETSQHPDFQLMIVNALKELSETENAQVFFTTHNSNLAKEIPKASLRYVFSDNGQVRIKSGKNEDGSDNEEIIDKIIETLGALPDPKNKVKVLIFVEGENDVNALKGLSKLLNASDNSIINLVNNEAVTFIPTGGSQLKFYIEKKYLDGLLQAQVHIYDSDKKDYVRNVADLNAENINTKIGFNTKKVEIENYLHHEAIIECYRDKNINISLTEITDDDDVPLKVAKAVHQKTSETSWNEINQDPVKTEYKQKKKISSAKRQLNTLAIEKMTLEKLTERGGLDEIKEWLKTIKAFIK